jgi:hypothetical protein
MERNIKRGILELLKLIDIDSILRNLWNCGVL